MAHYSPLFSGITSFASTFTHCLVMDRKACAVISVANAQSMNTRGAELNHVREGNCILHCNAHIRAHAHVNARKETHMHMHANACTGTHAHTNTHTHINTHARVHASTHTQTRMYIYKHARAHAHTHIHAHTQYLHICTCMHTRTRAHTKRFCSYFAFRNLSWDLSSGAC